MPENTAAAGRDIAKIVADRLGYDCVDKELIAEIAHAAGVSEDVVEQLDEVGESAVRRFLGELFTPSTVYSLSPEYPPLIWPYVPGDDEGTKDPTSLKTPFWTGENTSRSFRTPSVRWPAERT